MNSFNGLPITNWAFAYGQKGGRPHPSEQTLTLSPHALFLNQPESSRVVHKDLVHDTKPVIWQHSSYDQFCRESEASNASMRSSAASRGRKHAAPTTLSMESRGSPASSLGESASSVSSHISDISEMSGAPFCTSFAGMFGMTTECLACGYRYDLVHELAEHQRTVHGMADVVF